MRKPIPRAPLIFSWINPACAMLCVFFLTQTWFEIRETSKLALENSIQISDMSDNMKDLKDDMRSVKERLNMASGKEKKLHITDGLCLIDNPIGNI